MTTYQPKVHNFQSSLVRGLIGERIVHDLLMHHPRFEHLDLKNNEERLWAVENEKEWQKKGIDKRLTKADGSHVYLEIKTDTYDKNFFFEIDSDSRKPKSGWTFTTQSDLVCYLFIHLGKVFFLPFPATRSWFESHLQTNPELKNICNRNYGREYSSSGCPVEINWGKNAIQNYSGIEVAEIAFTPWTKQELKDECEFYKEHKKLSF